MVHQHRLENKRGTYDFVAPTGTTEHDLLHPDFWSALGDQFARDDIIWLRAPDGSWEVELRCEKPGRSTMEVSIARRISRVPLDASIEWLNDTDYLTYMGPKGWCVFRRARTDRDEPTRVVGDHKSAGEARREWDRRQPKKVA